MFDQEQVIVLACANGPLSGLWKTPAVPTKTPDPDRAI